MPTSRSLTRLGAFPCADLRQRRGEIPGTAPELRRRSQRRWAQLW